MAISLFACETPEVANEEETITISVTGMEEDLLLGLDIDDIDYEPETRGAYQSSRQMTFTPMSRAAQSKLGTAKRVPYADKRRVGVCDSIGGNVRKGIIGMPSTGRLSRDVHKVRVSEHVVIIIVTDENGNVTKFMVENRGVIVYERYYPSKS